MQQPDSKRHGSGPAFALAAAVLFGLSTPFAKLIGEDLNAFLLAGLLYLGSGIGLAVWRSMRRRAGEPRTEAALQMSDFGWMRRSICVDLSARMFYKCSNFSSTAWRGSAAN